ncbi:MAG: type IV secretory system conjugative DNA transfer family protein [Litorimonas sp.]
MKNVINAQREKLLANPTVQTVRDYQLYGQSSGRLFVVTLALIVLIASLSTQGLGGSTVVQSLGALIGGGIGGGLTALVFVFLRLLLRQEGWKLAAAILGVGITAAVFTGSQTLGMAMPPFAALIGYLTGLGLVLNYFVRVQPPTQLPVIFGSARWANTDDLTEAKMIAPAPTGYNLDGTGETGLFLGQESKTGEAIIYNGDMHAITIAPTRTGKDQTAILPNLVRSAGSMIVVDPKGESARHTAKRRADMGHQVMIIDPWDITQSVDGVSLLKARFNPLDRLNADDPDLASDALLYADALVLEDGQSPHWPNEAKALIAGFLAYIVSEKREAQRRNLGRLRDILCLPLMQRDENGKATGEAKGTLDEVLDRMLKSKISFVKNSAYRFLQKDWRERASVVSTAHANTHFLESVRIRESLSKSDFSFADLKGQTPVTVYLTLPLDRMDTFSRWLRLLISTALIELTRKAENDQPHPVRFILNEFAALGRLNTVETAFGTMAGLGVQLWAITQDLSQLKRLYGAESWQTFVANAGVFQYFGSRDFETAKYAEHLCGLTTLKKRSVSFGTSHSSGAQGGSSGSSETVSIDDVQRPLVFADELMRMPRDEQLLLVENLPPIKAQKWWWYRNQPDFETGG